MSEDPQAKLTAAVAHPVRRRILRAIADSGERRSPAQVARGLDLPVGTATYQMTVLAKCGALKPIEQDPEPGAIEHLYGAALDGDPPLEALLEQAREADERGDDPLL